MKYPNYIPKAREYTVRDFYRTDDPIIPCGWESTGEFRPPTKNDIYLLRDGTTDVWVSNITLSTPHIILRKIKRIVFTYVRTGQARQGEWFTSAAGCMNMWGIKEPSTGEYKIYRRTEEE